MSEPTKDLQLHVMISSTTVDLPDHRDAVREAIQRANHTPVMMELGSAEWKSDPIKFSLQKVAQSQVYVGIFALRYGYIPEDPVRNPGRLSITELEYRHAVELDIPTLIYIAKKSHPFEEDQIDFDPEKREKLKRLKEELQKGICAFFESAADLKTLVLQSLHEIQEKLGDRSRPSANVVKPRLPAPPALYAAPNYILTNTFIGRATELDDLDAWASSTDPLMVVEGIGGLGKSALTWEWMQRRATNAIHDLAGRVWWSFYYGTSMSAFVRHALAYVTGQDPETLSKETGHYQRCQELLTELKRRPFLLVLDGFERVLTAYQRWDKAQQRDDKIEANLRECVEPRDGELLQQLLHGSPSKVILSTRLFPSILEDSASAGPIPGVAHHHLNGLSRLDTRDFFRHAGIMGSEKAMLEFADQFGRHSLVLKVVCGEIAKYPPRPFHFDAWRADPIYGGKLKLSELDLKMRYNHILRFALEGLDEPKRKLLCRIAVLSEDVTFDTLAVLNPYLTPGQPMAEAEYRQAVRSFGKSLQELQDRGLLQRDHDTGNFDMHPVVRGTAAEILDDGERKQTFLTVRDYFAGLPPDDFSQATQLEHLKRSLEIYRCLIGAGRFDEAARFYRGALADTILFHVGAYSLMVELLTPLYVGGKDGLPCLKTADDQAYIVLYLADAYYYLGRFDEALDLFAKGLRIDLARKDWEGTETTLNNYGHTVRELGRLSQYSIIVHLRIELAEAIGDEKLSQSRTLIGAANEAIQFGRLDEAERLLQSLRQRPLPPVDVYRPGDVEYLASLGQFYRGALTEAECRRGCELAKQHRNIDKQYRFLAMLAEWLLTQNQPGPALTAIDEALKIVNRVGTPRPDYHDLRAWALAKLGHPDARTEFANGQRRRFAAEARRILGDHDEARTCAVNAYRWAWGEGRPYVFWYELECSRALLRELEVPEPQLPPFDPSKLPPIPFEQEIRAVIEKLKAEKASPR